MSDSLEAAERRRAWALLAPALSVAILFFVVPFLGLAAMSLWSRRGREIVATWDLGNYAAILERSYFLDALANSLEIAALVTVLSVLLAYPFAWIVAMRVPERWQRLALMLAVLPFWTSYVVRSYAWSLVLAREGVVNDALVGLGLLAEPLSIAASRTATVIGFVHFFVMLMTLTIYASLKQLPTNTLRAAADLGASTAQTFRHVVLPLSLPGVMVGAFLTFVLCIGDYVTPQVLGGNSELVLPQVILFQIERRADLPMASALAVVLMLTVTLAYALCARWLTVKR